MVFSGFKKAAVLVVSVLSFAGCSDRYATIDEQVVTAANARRIDDTLMTDSLKPFYFSRLRRPSSFGFSHDYKVPEERQGKELYVVVSGRSRTNYAQSGAVIVVVTHKDAEQLSWMVIPMKYHYPEQNAWCEFRDSVRLPETIDGKKYNLVTTVAHLTVSTEEKFDMDSLHVTIKQKL